MRRRRERAVRIGNACLQRDVLLRSCRSLSSFANAQIHQRVIKLSAKKVEDYLDVLNLENIIEKKRQSDERRKRDGAAVNKF